MGSAGADQSVRDYVFPLVTVEPDDDGLKVVAFRGTAFLVGPEQGVAMTARHVAEKLEVGSAAGLFVEPVSGIWRPAAVRAIDLHPSEDVAMLRMEGDPQSPLRFLEEPHKQSCRYRLWGYPEDVIREQVNDWGFAELRPDLVYSEGHVRRRLTGIPLAGIRGSAFFELSASAGAGCSGAPLTIDRAGYEAWQVIGVYVGERYNEKDRILVGYAARILEALESWET